MTDDYELAAPPASPGAYWMWMEQVTGYIVFDEARRRAIQRIDPSLTPEVRAHVEEAIDSTMFAFLATFTQRASLWNESEGVELLMIARHVRGTPAGEDNEVLGFIDIAESGEVLGLYHEWVEGDFGDDPVVRRKPEGWREAASAAEKKAREAPCPPDDDPGCGPASL